MPSGDHCVVWGCNKDRGYPEEQKILPHAGILRFYSPRNNNDVLSWVELLIVTNSRFQSVQRSVQINLYKVTEPLIVLHQLCT